MSLSILIVDDHHMVAEGLSSILRRLPEISDVRIATSPSSVLSEIERFGAGLVLLDVNLRSEVTGLALTRQIREAQLDVRILMLTMYTDPATIAEAIRAGVDGFLSKHAPTDELVHAIGEVANGKGYLDPNVTKGLFDRFSGVDAQALTDREISVLQAFSLGRPVAQIARDLSVSQETVRAHVKHIFHKLGVHDRTEAVAEAFRRGLVH